MVTPSEDSCRGDEEVSPWYLMISCNDVLLHETVLFVSLPSFPVSFRFFVLPLPLLSPFLSFPFSFVVALVLAFLACAAALPQDIHLHRCCTSGSLALESLLGSGSNSWWSSSCLKAVEDPLRSIDGALEQALFSRPSDRDLEVDWEFRSCIFCAAHNFILVRRQAVLEVRSGEVWLRSLGEPPSLNLATLRQLPPTLEALRRCRSRKERGRRSRTQRY